MYMDTLPRNVRARDAAAAELQQEKRQILGPIVSIITGILDPNDPETSRLTNTRTVTVTSTRPTLGIPTPTFNNPFTTRTTSTSTTPFSSATRGNTFVPNNPVFTTSTSTLSLATGTPDSQNGQTTSTQKKGLPAAVIGIIVAAAVIFGLIFIAIIARKVFQRRRRNKRTTWGGSMISPYEAPLVKEKSTVAAPVAPTPFAYPSASAAMNSLSNRTVVNNIVPPVSTIRNPGYGGGGSGPYPSFPPPIASFGGGNSNSNPNGSSINSYSSGPAASTAYGGGAPYTFGGATAGPSNTVSTPKPTSSAGLQVQALSVVKRTFVPSLPDELSIANGETVRILSVYDDGWALCEKLNGGDKGVVPQECLEPAGAGGPPKTPNGQLGGDSSLKRNSSLRGEQGNRY